MAEESKEIQDIHKFLRLLVYASLILEFFVFVFDESMLAKFPAAGVWIRSHELLSTFYIYTYDHLAYSKIATVILVIVTSIGTKNKKLVEYDARKLVLWPLIFGTVMTVGSVILYYNEFKPVAYHLTMNVWLYIIASIIGTTALHVALDNISKFLKDNMLKDRFNFENESFEQITEKIENKYSVNIPMRFYHKGKFRKGWINIIAPFRGTWVVGTPGSGKTFSVIEPFIRQHAAKGFSLVVYDYKFPTLAKIVWYQYLKNKGKTTPYGDKIPNFKFNIINFVDVEYSRRVNPIQQKYIDSLAAAQETAETLVDSLQKGKKEGGGGSDAFFTTSAVNFLAACIYFFVNYNKVPYKNNPGGKPIQLYAEYTEDPETKHRRYSGRAFADKTMKIPAEPDFWLGEFSDMPHVLSFLNHDYTEIFEVLKTDTECAPLLGPFMTAYDNKAMEQLEGMIGTLRVQISRLATKEAYWVFHKDGDDFDLKVSDPNNPSYLIIANDPEKESIIGALNAMILNRLTTRVNSGMGKNVPVDIIVDEVPTLYFHKIDRLIGTARSNKVAVVLGFQELPQLEADYGKVGMQKIITTVGNVISGSARAKETLEWLSNEIFGKVKQMKKGITIDRDRTSINLNENMDSLVPASKISDMPAGWLCGQTARDFMPTKMKQSAFEKWLYKTWLFKKLNIKPKTPKGDFSMKIQETDEFQTSKFYCKTDFDMDALNKETSQYPKMEMPKFYNFPSRDARERILYANFDKVNEDVVNMIKRIYQPPESTKK